MCPAPKKLRRRFAGSSTELSAQGRSRLFTDLEISCEPCDVLITSLVEEGTIADARCRILLKLSCKSKSSGGHPDVCDVSS